MEKINRAQIKVIARRVAKKYKPERIILFGSHAWGVPGPASDVDLCVIKETRNTRHMAREIDGFIFPRQFPIDVVVYTPTQVEKRKAGGDLFVRKVLEKGEVLYDK